MITLAEVQDVLSEDFPLPAPYEWKLENYCGDFDAGIGEPGQSGVKVGITKPLKFGHSRVTFFRGGTVIVLVSSTGRVTDFQEAALKVYSHSSLKDRGILG